MLPNFFTHLLPIGCRIAPLRLFSMVKSFTSSGCPQTQTPSPDESSSSATTSHSAIAEPKSFDTDALMSLRDSTSKLSATMSSPSARDNSTEGVGRLGRGSWIVRKLETSGRESGHW